MKRWVGTDGMLDSLAHRLKTTAMLSKLAQRVAGHHSPPQAPVQEASSVLHQWVLSPSHESQPPQQHWWADLGSGPGFVGVAPMGLIAVARVTTAPAALVGGSRIWPWRRRRRRGCWRRSRRGGHGNWRSIRGDPPIPDDDWLHVAGLRTITASIAIHPVHVGSIPITSHEGHPLLQAAVHHHVGQLRVARTHLHHLAPALLGHRGGEDHVTTVGVEHLGELERLAAVDGVLGAWAEVARMSLNFGISPLVALPIRMTFVTALASASMVCDLLNFIVSLVHVKLSATTFADEALSIAIVISLVAWLGHRHIHEVEIEVAPT